MQASHGELAAHRPPQEEPEHMGASFCIASATSNSGTGSESFKAIAVISAVPHTPYAAHGPTYKLDSRKQLRNEETHQRTTANPAPKWRDAWGVRGGRGEEEQPACKAQLASLGGGGASKDACEQRRDPHVRHFSLPLSLPCRCVIFANDISNSAMFRVCLLPAVFLEAGVCA